MGTTMERSDFRRNVIDLLDRALGRGVVVNSGVAAPEVRAGWRVVDGSSPPPLDDPSDAATARRRRLLSAFQRSASRWHLRSPWEPPLPPPDFE